MKGGQMVVAETLPYLRQLGVHPFDPEPLEDRVVMLGQATFPYQPFNVMVFDRSQLLHVRPSVKALER
jgi:hypothetical protein